MSETKHQLDVNQIQKFLPHRAPFLLVDRILGIEPTGTLGGDYMGSSDKVGTRVVARKNVSFNEPHMAGHFPGFAIMPGVLITECMAQTASFAVYPYMAHDLENLARQFSCILVAIDGARFRRPVVPGDTMTIEAVVTKCRGKLWVFDCKATVDGELAAEASIMANLVPAAQ